jgi:hypothetical protein
MPVEYTNTTDITAKWLPAIDTSSLVANGVVISTLVAAALEEAAAKAERSMGQSLLYSATPKEARIEGTGMRNVQLPNFPVHTLSSLKLYYGWDQLLYDFVLISHSPSRLLSLPGQLGAPEAYVERDTGIVTINPAGQFESILAGIPLFGGTFERAGLNVLATYTCGFSVVPRDVAAAVGKLAVLEVAEMAKARMTAGATSMNAGSGSKSFSPTAGYASLTEKWERDIEQTLSKWRIAGLGGG